jgi:hypothetical protein
MVGSAAALTAAADVHVSAPTLAAAPRTNSRLFGIVVLLS